MSTQTGQVMGRPTTTNPEGTQLKMSKIMGNEDRIDIDILGLNGLNYSIPDNNSVVTRRTLIRSMFSRSVYGPNDTATINLNSGDLYVYGKNSYLCFQLGVNGGYSSYTSASSSTQTSSPSGSLTYDARFGRGSAANILNNCTFTTASGTEVERIINAGQHIVYRDRMEMSDDWLKTYGGLMGYKWLPHTQVNSASVLYSGSGPTAASTSIVSLTTTRPATLTGPPVGYAVYSNSTAATWSSQTGSVLPASGLVDYYPLMDDGSGFGGWYGDSVLYNYCGQQGVSTDINAGTVMTAKAPNVVCLNNTTAATSATLMSTTCGSYEYYKPAAKWYCIPLSRIFGLFDTDKLIPNTLIGGARIDLTFNQGNVSFMWKGADTANVAITNLSNTNYVITNASIVLDTVQLSDPALMKLNEIGSKFGLDFAYPTMDNTETTATMTTNINLDNKRAVSRAIYAYYRIRRAVGNNPLDLACSDSYASYPLLFNNYQFQLAGMYFPQQFVGNSSTNTSGVVMVDTTGGAYALVNSLVDNEQFLNFLYCANKLIDRYGPSSITAKSYSHYDSCGICTLERSCVLDMSGLPVATSRILTFKGLLSSVPTISGTAENVTQDLNLIYWRMAKCFLSKIIVRE